MGRVLRFAVRLVRDLAHADPGTPTVILVWFTKRGGTLVRAGAHDELRELLRDVRWDALVLQQHTVHAAAAGRRGVPMTTAARRHPPEPSRVLPGRLRPVRADHRPPSCARRPPARSRL